MSDQNNGVVDSGNPGDGGSQNNQAPETNPVTEPNTDFTPEWKSMASGGDADLDKFLGRYSTPNELARFAMNEQRQKNQLVERAKLAPPPADAKPEDIAKWREGAGVPSEAKGYLDGFDLPDTFDKVSNLPVLEAFTEAFHQKHLPKGVAADLMTTYFDLEAKAQQEFMASAEKAAREAETSLSKQLGGLDAFDRAMAATRSYGADLIGEEQYDKLANMVVVDPETGNPVGVLGNNENFYKLLIGNARDAMGDDFSVPVGDPATAIETIEEKLRPLDDKRLTHIRGQGPDLTPEEHQTFSRLSAAATRARARNK